MVIVVAVTDAVNVLLRFIFRHPYSVLRSVLEYHVESIVYVFRMECTFLFGRRG